MSMIAVNRLYATTIRRMFRRVYEGNITDASCWLRRFRRDFFFRHVRRTLDDKRERWLYVNIVFFLIRNIALFYYRGFLKHACVFLFYAQNIEILSHDERGKGDMVYSEQGNDIIIEFRGYTCRLFYEERFSRLEFFDFYLGVLTEEAKRVMRSLRERNI